MTGRFAEIERVFHEALARTGPERDAYLAETCGADAELRAEVEALLDESHGGSDPIDRVIAEAAAADDEESAMPDPGSIPGFRLLGVLGEGGMGRVYEAEQDSPRRRVALKVIRPGLFSRAVLRRFAHEADVLGQLRHPGIAQVYQAGSVAVKGTGLGGATLPYFAMELVRGRPLTEFARANNLGVRERLELLARICDAVQHAHQRGVIHRDLKPANILVESAEAARSEASDQTTTGDAGGWPKILDFGIARLVDESGAAPVTVQTEVGQIIGTLAYMSPEQVEGDPRAVDTRSDVYSLGVIAYELLAGRAPLPIDGKPITEAVRLVKEVEPPRLGNLDPALRGDVETIVSKALEKDRERRYASAAELAADIRRHLRDEPIAARPASTLYQLGKFARRNKPLVAGAAVAAAALVAGATAAVWQARIAVRERDAARAAQAEAEAAQRRAEGVKDFLIEDVFGPTKFERGGPNVTVVDLLAQAAPRAGERFGDDPEIHGLVEDLLGTLAFRAGQNDSALTHMRKAVELFAQVYGQEDERTVRAELHSAQILASTGMYPRDLLKLVPALRARAERAFGARSTPAMQARMLEAAAYVQDNRPADGMAIFQQVVEEFRGTPSEEDIEYGYALNMMCASKRALGDVDGALEWSSRTLEWMGKHVDPDSPHLAAQRIMHGHLLGRLGRWAEAEPLLRQACEVERRILRPDDPSLGIGLGMWGLSLMHTGRPEEAEAPIREGFEIVASRFPADNWETFNASRKLHALYLKLGDPERLEAWFRAEIARLDGKVDPAQEHLLDARRLYAEWLTEAGRLDEAEAVLSRAESDAGGRDAEMTRGIHAALRLARAALLDARGEHAPAAELRDQAMRWFEESGVPHLYTRLVEREKQRAEEASR